MDTEAFLRHILPAQGQKILAVPHVFAADGVSRTGWKYYTFASIAAMAEAAQQLDEQDKTVYFAVNGYGDWYTDATGKRRLRTQDNVVACRALYDDFDIDPDNPSKYASREAALVDIRRLAEALRLVPTITSSGGGFHCYFTADADLSPEEWLWLSARKRDITTHLGMKVDRAVDMDSARILRPVGTHNRKTGEPRPVVAVKAGRHYEYKKLDATLVGYIREHNVGVAPAAGREKVANPFASALGEYPPSSAHRIIEHCAALRGVAEARGAVDEPLWRAMLGTVKRCLEGEALCHEWSQGDPRYDATQCQAKIDNWLTGPPSCATFDALVGCKQTCPHAETAIYPIRLGYTDQGVPAAPPTPAAPPEAETPAAPPGAETPAVGAIIEGEHIPYWPENGYRWSGAALARYYTDDDGVGHWRPFCRSLIYPINRVRTEDGTWALHLRAREQNGHWREFFIPTSDLASLDMMAKSLAQHEVFLFQTKNARFDMAEYFVGMTERLQRYRVETRTTERFGWTDDYSGFVIGNKMIRADREEEVLCGGDIPGDVRSDLGTAGSLDEWVRNVDRLLNRPGAEMMQFALCHMMGSPLVKLMNSSNWHGIPYTLVGESGHGKSTIAKIACGFFGDPRHFERQANDQGATINAAIKRVAAMNNLPFVFDEVSGRSTDDIIRLGYALGNGRDKERLGSNGKFNNVGGEWFLNSIATSNESLHEKVDSHPSADKSEAAALRFFEVTVPGGYLQSVFPDLDRTWVEAHMHEQYGHACRPYLRFIMTNKDWVQRQLRRAREKFNPSSQEETKERFYTDAVVTAMVAGKIATRLGLIQFDVKRMVDWAFERIAELRGTRKQSRFSPAEYVAQFIASLHGRTIVTKYLGDGRAKTATEVPMEPLRAPAVARIAMEDKRVLVTVKALRDWCRDNNIAPAVVKKELERMNYLVHRAGEPRYITVGTTLPGTLARCYELDYNALFGAGVALRVVKSEGSADGSVTESVTA